MNTFDALHTLFRQSVHRDRLVATATEMVAIPSWTGDAGAVLDRMSAMLTSEGFAVDRVTGGYDKAPAVVVRLDSGKPGPTIQFNGHVDVVHLPYVAPAQRDGQLIGSGSCDMKGGTACAIEALRLLRDTKTLTAGRVLFTAHDLHEAPWGFGEQLDQMIHAGIHGDAVLLPEPLSNYLPLVGRGAATWKVSLRRAGAPVHEVMRPLDEPSVIAAGAHLVPCLNKFQEQLNTRRDPQAGHETIFVGQIHSGEIYNQYPQACWLEGTRRWLPGVKRSEVESEFRALVEDVARATRTTATIEYRVIRDAFRLEPTDPLVTAFQSAYRTMEGEPLVEGVKPFVDDGNSFYGLGPIPAITHGPRAGGQHTVNEWVDINDMVRVACLYALTAVVYCTSGPTEGKAS
jgi:acetylornithine deacetylase/succinyl-diaminopimelate desuccinylase-like protein